MTISFENYNEVIIYTLEKIISYARDNQYIFLAQSIWWISWIIGLQLGLVTYIVTLQFRSKFGEVQHDSSETPSIELLNSEQDRPDKILRECEKYLLDSKCLRDIANLKHISKTSTGRINPLKFTQKTLPEKHGKKAYPQTEEIELDTISRRKSAGQGLHCAWPSKRKGSHWVKDCIRPIKLDKGTIKYPQAKLLSNKQRYTLQSIPKNTMASYLNDNE